MRYLHTMVRVRDVDESLDFYCNKLGLVEMRRKDVPEGRFTLIFLAAPKDQDNSSAQNAPELELTYNWDPEDYDYCLLYTSPSPRDGLLSRMPSSA